MSLSLIAACLWVILGAVTAALPMKYQVYPGSVLLLSAIPIMVWIGSENGWHWTLIALLAFGSMFRRPLGYLLARARGERPEFPPEMRS